MAGERENVRFYTDVLEGFVPQSVIWVGVYANAIPPACTDGYKRIWMEVEIPSDRDLWADRFEGFYIGGVGRDVGQRAMQVDLEQVETGSAVRPSPVAEVARPARRRRITPDEVAEATPE